MGTICHLPGLRKLTTDFLDGSMSNGSGNDADLYITNGLEELGITNCFAKAEDLEYLFQTCHSLKSLKLTWGMREDNYRRLDWDDLGSCITESMPNLQHLCLLYYRVHAESPAPLPRSRVRLGS